MDFKNVVPAVWVRVIVLVIVLVNQVLVNFGVMDTIFGEDIIYENVNSVLTIGSVVWIIWCAWKNNSFTPAAQAGDAVMDYEKNGKDGAVKVGEAEGITDELTDDTE